MTTIHISIWLLLGLLAGIWVEETLTAAMMRDGVSPVPGYQCERIINTYQGGMRP